MTRALVVVIALGFGFGLGLGLSGCGLLTATLADGSKTVNPSTCRLAVTMAAAEVDRCDDIDRGDESDNAKRKRGGCRVGAEAALAQARVECDIAQAKVDADREAAEDDAGEGGAP